MIDTNKIKCYLKSRGIEDYEIYFEDATVLSVNLRKDKIDFVSEGRSGGLSVRISVGGKLGFCSTMNLQGYKGCVDKAIKIAKLNEKDKKFKRFPAATGIYPKVLRYNKRLLDYSLDNIRDFVSRFVDNVKSVSQNIVVSSGNYGKCIGNMFIVNSEGIDVESKFCYNYFFEELIENGNAISLGDESKLPIAAEKGKADAIRLIALRNRSVVNTDEMQLLLHPEALGPLIADIFAFSIDAENVQLGRSYFKEKLGQTVFDKKLSVVDNALAKDLLNTRPNDGEGTPSKKTVVIDKGALRSFLYDSYTAYHEGKESTGNASRTFTSSPSVAPTNIIINKTAGGGKDEDALIGMIDKGIYIKGLLGAHTIDYSTGDFSLGVTEGFLIDKGEIKHPVKDTMIAGNFFELMNKVDAVGKKIVHGMGGFYLPHVLFPKIKVIGK